MIKKIWKNNYLSVNLKLYICIKIQSLIVSYIHNIKLLK